jgi:hypothetical protein
MNYLVYQSDPRKSLGANITAALERYRLRQESGPPYVVTAQECQHPHVVVVTKAEGAAVIGKDQIWMPLS